MTAFEQYLSDNGYKPHKQILSGKRPNREFISVPITEHECSSFTTMVDGRLDNEWILGDQKIYFGLNEQNKPPTLISPRPTIKINKDGRVLSQIHDDAMNIVLKKCSPEEILTAINDKKVIEITI